VKSQLEGSTSIHQTWIDLLRIIAIYQVILIHASFPIFFKPDLHSSYLLAANFYDSFSRASVPVFFIISGYLLLGRTESISDFLRRRFLKVGIPTLAWTIAYLIWHEEAYRDGSMNVLHIGLSMTKAVFAGDTELHLWFAYVLLCLYLVVPILRVLVSAAPAMLNYFLLLWLLANPLINLMSKISGEAVQPALRILPVEGYVGYMVFGYVLGQLTLSKRIGRYAALTFLLMGFVIYFGTNALSAQAGESDTYLYDYLGFPVIIMAGAFFLWFKAVGGSNNGRIWRFIRILSDASFGIYLMHIFILEGLRAGWFGFNVYSWMAPSIYMIPLTGLAVFAIGFVITFVMQKTPVLKHLV